jgi:hypothetical protein
MTATIHPSGRRAAATWVGATGSFLVVAAAAVFVAVKWNDIPDLGKLAIIAGLTAACLAGGRAMRASLPATGDVLFHLGAFLVPVDIASVCLRFDVGWRTTLLVEGGVGVALFAGLARATGSVALARAAALAMLVLAAGIAGVTPVPATLALALIAVGAEALRLRTPAAVWAAVAGLAPALGAAAGFLLRGLEGTRLHIGAGTLAELGLTSRPQQAVALVSGLLAAGVLARQANGRRDLRLAFLALASVAVGIGTAAVAVHVDGHVALLGLAALFVIVELVAFVLYDDDFWGRPLATTAVGAEACAAALTIAGGVALVIAPLFDPLGTAMGDVTHGAALALVALGWLAADMRRVERGSSLLRQPLVQGAGWMPANVAVALSLAGAVAVATGSGLATAVALLTVATALVAARRSAAIAIAAGFLPWAVLTASNHPLAVPAIGALGGLVLAVCARRVDRVNGVALAIDATATAVVASFWLAGPLDLWHAIYVAASVAWLLGLVLDRSGPRLGDVARLAMLVPLATTVGLRPSAAIVPLAWITALYVLDGVRLDRPQVAAGAALAVQPLVVALARANGVPVEWAGFALCVCAFAWGGLAAVVDGRWRLPFVVAAGAGLFFGAGLAWGHDEALSDCLLVAGALGIVAGVATRETPMGHVGGAVLTGGIWGHLALAGVTAPEPYLAPVAVQLLVAGGQLRRTHALSSWIAYVPSIVLLGGTAFFERARDGGGEHALVAGAVGVTAVAIGGWRRLAGPMVAGTALVGLVSLRESLWALAGVPTWAWLGLGGAVLLAIAIMLERSDASPGEAGRRVVEVLAERFS